MTTPVASAAPPAQDTNPFPYGYRYLQRPGTNGDVVHDQVPLTLEDVLHPLEDDVISENTDHNNERDYIKRACRSRLRRRTGALVMSDCIIDWDHPTIRPMSPDVSVIFEVADPQLRREYRRRLGRLLRERPDPAVLFIYLVKCGMHYHHYTMSQQMTADETQVVNSF